MDTACSASLVSLHMACQALRQGECSLARGGRHRHGEPRVFVDFSRQRGLSPDGRCRAYGAGANGTGFSDGVGVLVLERLSVARERGHRVLAVARQRDQSGRGLERADGARRASQERVIRQALANAGLEPDDVDAVEDTARGPSWATRSRPARCLRPTGASARTARSGSDRQEQHRPRRPLRESAGVIKMVMALRHGVLPPTLRGGVLAARGLGRRRGPRAGGVRGLARGERPRRAGVVVWDLRDERAPAARGGAAGRGGPRRPGASDPSGHAALPPIRVERGGARGAVRPAAGVCRGSTRPRRVRRRGSLALGRAQLPHRAVALAPGLDELGPS